jgi:hypothetical protein
MIHFLVQMLEDVFLAQLTKGTATPANVRQMDSLKPALLRPVKQLQVQLPNPEPQL